MLAREAQTLINRGSHRRGDHRGAALVELALALPLIVMLIVGMVSAGVAYNHQLSLTHAAREGGRYAATLPVVPNFANIDAWLNEVATQVVNDATGTLDPGVPGRYVCVAYVYPDGDPVVNPNDATRSRVQTGTAAPTYPASPCFNDGRPNNERRVQVEVRRDTTFNALVFSSTFNLDSEAVNRFEPS